jgi:hypothetical protein
MGCLSVINVWVCARKKRAKKARWSPRFLMSGQNPEKQVQKQRPAD